MADLRFDIDGPRNQQHKQHDNPLEAEPMLVDLLKKRFQHVGQTARITQLLYRFQQVKVVGVGNIHDVRIEQYEKVHYRNCHQAEAKPLPPGTYLLHKKRSSEK